MAPSGDSNLVFCISIHRIGTMSQCSSFDAHFVLYHVGSHDWGRPAWKSRKQWGVHIPEDPETYKIFPFQFDNLDDSRKVFLRTAKCTLYGRLFYDAIIFSCKADPSSKFSEAPENV